MMLLYAQKKLTLDRLKKKKTNNITGTVEIQGVLGKLEIQYASIKACGNKNNCETFLSMSVKKML